MTITSPELNALQSAPNPAGLWGRVANSPTGQAISDSVQGLKAVGGMAAKYAAPIAKYVGPAGAAAYEGANAYSDIAANPNAPTSLKVGRALQGVGETIGGTLGAIPAAIVGGGIGTAVAPGAGTLAGGAIGGLAGYKAGAELSHAPFSVYGDFFGGDGRLPSEQLQQRKFSSPEKLKALESMDVRTGDINGVNTPVLTAEEIAAKKKPATTTTPSYERIPVPAYVQPAQAVNPLQSFLPTQAGGMRRVAPAYNVGAAESEAAAAQKGRDAEIRNLLNIALYGGPTGDMEASEVGNAKRRQMYAMQALQQLGTLDTARMQDATARQRAGLEHERGMGELNVHAGQVGAQAGVAANELARLAAGDVNKYNADIYGTQEGARRADILGDISRSELGLKTRAQNLDETTALLNAQIAAQAREAKARSAALMGQGIVSKAEGWGISPDELGVAVGESIAADPNSPYAPIILPHYFSKAK